MMKSPGCIVCVRHRPLCAPSLSTTNRSAEGACRAWEPCGKEQLQTRIQTVGNPPRFRKRDFPNHHAA
jgi:hypothetical protein